MPRRPGLALILLAAIAAAAMGTARGLPPGNVSVVAFRGDGDGFGGWSGLDVSEDGRAFRAIGDSASMIRGEFLREDGRLIGVRTGDPVWLEGFDAEGGLALAEDAEGLSVLPDGAMLLSFERLHRVARYDESAALVATIPPSLRFRDFAFNGGLEALATTADGTILAIPEIPPGRDAPYVVFATSGGQWSSDTALERDGRWRAVGADVGPDGRLYLLERQFWGIGFASRIRRFDLAAPGPVIPGETVYRAPPGRHGNLEGIGIWQDPQGRIRAVLVSDDNFLPIFQRSELVEIILDR